VVKGGNPFPHRSTVAPNCDQSAVAIDVHSELQLDLYDYTE
jgi:hypothetical protein